MMTHSEYTLEIQFSKVNPSEEFFARDSLWLRLPHSINQYNARQFEGENEGLLVYFSPDRKVFIQPRSPSPRPLIPI